MLIDVTKRDKMKAMENFLNYTNIPELAKATNIPRATLYRYKNDLSSMKVRDLQRISRVLGLSDEMTGRIVKAI